MKSKKQNNCKAFCAKGKEIINSIKKITKAKNARRIIIKNSKDKKIIAIPLAVGIIIVRLIPLLIALGILVALITKCTIIFEKNQEK